jgi:pseudouridine-5'-phosphate glycosidase/pseudouridine kinase
MKKYSTGTKDIKVAFEPVSAEKSATLFQSATGPASDQLGIFPNHNIDLATPNHHELAAMHMSAKEHQYFEFERWWQVIDALGIRSSGARDRFVSLTSKKMTDEGIPLQTIQLLPMIPTILTKVGAEGVLLTELLKPTDPRLTDPESAPYILSRCSNGSREVGGVYMRLFPAVEEVDDVVSVNGVGDTFLGVLIAGLARGLELGESLINLAQKGAVMTLRSKESVSPLLPLLKPNLDFMARERQTLPKSIESTGQ